MKTNEDDCKNKEECLTFICPCIANMFAEYNQQDATFLNLFISLRRSTCFRRLLCPSSGARNCTYSIRYLWDQYCYLTLYVQFWAPDDGRSNRLKHVERLREISKLWNVASCWLYSANKEECIFPRLFTQMLSMPLTFKVFWPEVISNEELWKLGQEKPITLQMNLRKWEWFGHSLRKDSFAMEK